MTPVKELLLHVPPSGPYGERCPFPEPSFTYLFTQRTSVPHSVPGPYVNQTSPWTSVRAFGPWIQSSLYESLPPWKRFETLEVYSRSPFGAFIKGSALFPEPLVYSCIHISQSPHLRSSSTTHGEKNTVTIHRAPRGQKAYIQWGAAWFPKGIVHNTVIVYPSAIQPSAWYLPPWFR
jgi:hypothetical protein